MEMEYENIENLKIYNNPLSMGTKQIKEILTYLNHSRGSNADKGGPFIELFDTNGVERGRFEFGQGSVQGPPMFRHHVAARLQFGQLRP